MISKGKSLMVRIILRQIRREAYRKVQMKYKGKALAYLKKKANRELVGRR